MILSLVRIIKAFRDYNRAYRELSELSERELADIGIDRGARRARAGHCNCSSETLPLRPDSS